MRRQMFDGLGGDLVGEGADSECVVAESSSDFRTSDRENRVDCSGLTPRLDKIDDLSGFRTWLEWRDGREPDAPCLSGSTWDTPGFRPSY